MIVGGKLELHSKGLTFRRRKGPIAAMSLAASSSTYLSVAYFPVINVTQQHGVVE